MAKKTNTATAPTAPTAPEILTDEIKSKYYTISKTAECSSVSDITKLENNLSAYRAAYQEAQDNAMRAISTWFKAWRGTDAAKDIRQITENFTRIYSAPVAKSNDTVNGVRCSTEEKVWSIPNLTTPAKWANALEWAEKVATGKVCKRVTGDAAGITKADAIARAKKVVNHFMGTDMEDRSLQCYYDCKNAKYDDLLLLEIEMTK